MKRKIALYVSGLALMILIATSAFALLRETDINYYGEDAFLTWTGEWDQDCDGYIYTAGASFDSWRVYDQYSCRTGLRVVHKCQQTDGMGGWIDLACPANQP